MNFKKALGVGLVFSMCVGSAFAAYGVVTGDTVASGGVYFDANGKPYSKFGCQSTSSDESVDASYIDNLYTKASIIDDDNGAVYKYDSSTDHNVNYGHASTSFTWYYGTDQINVTSRGYHKARYSDNTVSDAYSYGGGMVMGGKFSRSANDMEQKSFGTDPSCRKSIEDVVSSEYDFDLTDFNYIGFDDLWNADIDDSLKPLQSIIRDIFVEAETGDFIPFGVFYKGDTAYTVTKFADGTENFTKYYTGESDMLALNSESNSDYTIVDVITH